MYASDEHQASGLADGLRWDRLQHKEDMETRRHCQRDETESIRRRQEQDIDKLKKLIMDEISAICGQLTAERERSASAAYADETAGSTMRPIMSQSGRRQFTTTAETANKSLYAALNTTDCDWQ